MVPTLTHKGILRKIKVVISSESFLLTSILGILPIHLACVNGHLEVVAYLLSVGALLNDQSNSLRLSPLYCAAEKGHAKLVDFLASMGADVNCKTNKGVFPLYMAAQHGDMEVVKVLVARGARIHEYWNKPSNNAIGVAKLKKHYAVVRYLQSNGGSAPPPCLIQ